MDFAGIVTTEKTWDVGHALELGGVEICTPLALYDHHLPDKPLGVLRSVLIWDLKRIVAHLAIADVPGGREAADAVERGWRGLSVGVESAAHERRWTGGSTMKHATIHEISLGRKLGNQDCRILAWQRGEPYPKPADAQILAAATKTWAKTSW